MKSKTARVCGAIARPGTPQFGAHAFRSKREVWAYNLSKLYEEAVSRQWSSATDVPWDTLAPLPDDIEAAECQLATFFNEVEFVAKQGELRLKGHQPGDEAEQRVGDVLRLMTATREFQLV